MTLRDIELRRASPISSSLSLRRAWKTMQAENITTLCVTDSDGRLEGLITLKDVSTANLDGVDNYVLAKAGANYENVVDTLSGTVLAGDPVGKQVKGRIVVGAGSADQIEQAIHKDDVVIVSKRSVGQLTAIEMEVGCLVVCTGVEVSRIILRLARERNCLIVSTPHNVFITSQIISQAAPVGHYMLRDKLLTFDLNTTVEEASRVMASVRHRYFPVLGDDGRYIGMVSHRNLLLSQGRQE